MSGISGHYVPEKRKNEQTKETCTEKTAGTGEGRKNTGTDTE